MVVTFCIYLAFRPNLKHMILFFTMMMNVKMMMMMMMVVARLAREAQRHIWFIVSRNGDHLKPSLCLQTGTNSCLIAA